MIHTMFKRVNEFIAWIKTLTILSPLVREHRGDFSLMGIMPWAAPLFLRCSFAVSPL